MGLYRSQFWTDPRAQINPSPTAGHGPFATELIRQGQVVEIMGGVVMTEEEFRAFQAEAAREDRPYNAMQIGEDRHLVEPVEITATRRGSLNYSCDSNLWMGDEVTIMARRDIAAGEELTIDYALCTAQPDWMLNSECHCGAVVCRHVVTGEDWKRADVQARYQWHFSPFLNARIAKMASG